MTFLPIIVAVLALLSLLALLGAAFVVVRSGATKAAAEAWKGEAEAQKARADRLETSLIDLKSRVERLETDNSRLKDLATGSSAIADLHTLVVANHAQILYTVGAMTTAPTRRVADSA